MTAILAIRKRIDKKVHVIYAADSLMIRDNEKTILKNSHKFVEYDNFVALFAGLSAVQHILEDFQKRKILKNKSFMKMRNKSDAHEFATQVNSILKEKLEDLGSEEGGEDFQLLIATKNMLYSIDKWAFIVEHDEFVASGCGEPYITSILISQYHNLKSLTDMKTLAYNAIDVACQLHTSCGGPIIVKEFK